MNLNIRICDRYRGEYDLKPHEVREALLRYFGSGDYELHVEEVVPGHIAGVKPHPDPELLNELRDRIAEAKKVV